MKRKKPENLEKGQQFHGENEPEPRTAVVAVHPAGAAIAVAVGPELRVYDTRLNEVKVLRQKLEAGSGGRQDIRSLAFDRTGTHLVVGCDDKAQGILLWNATTWDKLQSIKVPKRVSDVALTHDGAYLLAADKFGDVQVAPTRPAGSNDRQPAAPELLLGHFCSILTSLTLSQDGRFVVTTDRDQKVRVSVMPHDPMEGAHEIQSYCLGHTAFVTCSAFVARDGKELLVTGGGDGTVRLWDHLEGSLLCTLDLQQRQQEQDQLQQEEEGEQQQLENGQQTEETGGVGEGGGSEAEVAAMAGMPAEAAAGAHAAVNGGDETGGDAACSGEQQQEDAPAVLSVAASPDGCWVAALLEDRDEALLLRMDWATRTLHMAGWHALEGLHMPTQLAFGPGNRLWAVGGPPTETSTTAFLACAALTPDGQLSGGAATGEQGALPADALQQLEARDGSEAEALAAANEERRQRRALWLHGLRRKPRYPPGQMDERKLLRRDVRAKLAAAAAAAAAAEAGQ